MAKLDRFVFIFIGIVWGLFGLSIIVKPAFYHSQLGFYFDFTSIRWPFGIFIIAVGILIVVVALRQKVSDEEFMICPKCETSYRRKDVPDLHCSGCKAELKKIKGYYKNKRKG